ncbi:hypothetical protein ACQJBY_005861 [Aegilops geniculata]
MRRRRGQRPARNRGLPHIGFMEQQEQHYDNYCLAAVMRAGASWVACGDKSIVYVRSSTFNMSIAGMNEVAAPPYQLQRDEAPRDPLKFDSLDGPGSMLTFF